MATDYNYTSSDTSSEDEYDLKDNQSLILSKKNLDGDVLHGLLKEQFLHSGR